MGFLRWILISSTVRSLVKSSVMVASKCEPGSQCAALSEESRLLAEDEDEGAALNLLQRRHLRRLEESRLAEETSVQLPPPFNEDDSPADYSLVFDKADGLPPLTPIVIPDRVGRSSHHSLNLHFNAVMSSCDSRLGNPQACDHVVSKSASSIFRQLHMKARLAKSIPSLTNKEMHNFKARFTELVVGSSKHIVTKTSVSARYSGWKQLVTKGYDNMRPLVPVSLVDFVNNHSEQIGWTATYDDSFAKVSVARGKTRLGFQMSPEEHEEMMNETLRAAPQDLLEIGEEEQQRDAFSTNFDVREHWPECRPVTTHVRYQTCSNCWSHSTALITESRLCINSRGKFNGPNAWLSQSFIAACRMDGQSYCNGGSGLLGFKTVSRWGVPTGGPDFRGNMQDGVQTCYPQILPNENGIRCPGACSPYVQYPRNLQNDLFYVQYQPRALHPAGKQTPYLVKQALMQDGPILLGMRIYQDFYAYRNGIYEPSRQSWNRYMGGHAVTGMGFGPGYILAVNSWSTAWGMDGAFHVVPEAIDFGYFLPGHPLGSYSQHNYPTLLNSM
eukprot:TRINITY_DN10208_c0_g1_i1.p1 TRINITY_DN10208_c0_g1~~TRINITY_DN10208_c0_g1_i1.p1  ORF type:complete len:557 (+),score=60.26 TRINITY_DN10208_c0_g1_i1:56-1726(+)